MKQTKQPTKVCLDQKDRPSYFSRASVLARSYERDYIKQELEKEKQLYKCCRCDGEFEYQLKSCYCNKCYDNYIKELEEENKSCKCCDDKVCNSDWECKCKCYGCGKTDLCPKDPRVNKKKKFNVDEYVKFIFQNTSYDPNAE